jgi:hypothetical protein
LTFLALRRRFCTGKFINIVVETFSKEWADYTVFYGFVHRPHPQDKLFLFFGRGQLNSLRRLISVQYRAFMALERRIRTLDVPVIKAQILFPLPYYVHLASHYLRVKR